MTTEPNRMSPDEVEAQAGSALPDKEAMSLLDVNANVAAPIDASVAANVLSFDSVAVASADQDSIIIQNLEGTAVANAIQDADIDQSGA